VRLIRDGLAARGFEVFWDQTVPASTDWDTWIRERLGQSRCVVAFWSVNSILSKNVRHEATVADQHHKLIPVLLDTLTAEQFPMGLLAVQCVDLTSWAGDTQDGEWLKLQRALEVKLRPPWLSATIDTLEAALREEQDRRQAVEQRHKLALDRIAKETQARAELGRERDH